MSGFQAKLQVANCKYVEEQSPGETGGAMQTTTQCNVFIVLREVIFWKTVISNIEDKKNVTLSL
jgi:hypothetical protein